MICKLIMHIQRPMNVYIKEAKSVLTGVYINSSCPDRTDNWSNESLSVIVRPPQLYCVMLTLGEKSSAPSTWAR